MQYTIISSCVSGVAFLESMNGADACKQFYNRVIKSVTEMKITRKRNIFVCFWCHIKHLASHTKPLLSILTLIILAWRKQSKQKTQTQTFDTVTCLTCKNIVLGLQEVLRTLATEVRPALFSVFPVNTTTETTGSWMSLYFLTQKDTVSLKSQMYQIKSRKRDRVLKRSDNKEEKEEVL